jgi:AmiR/NasT family two-component response regulator
VVGTIPSHAPIVKDDAVWLSNWDRTVTVPSGQGYRAASLAPVNDSDALTSAGTVGGGGARARVVIAEDEALIRKDLAEMLAEEGYVVVGQAADGARAVELAEEHRPDLVILDVKMPVLDGISAAERIARARIAPVVILTAFSQRDLVERARDAGAMAYLTKPFTRSDLVPAIEIAVSRFSELGALEAEIADLGDQLAARKAVDRAKGILQKELGLSEPDAFRWIQKTAMDLRRSMREVAEGVVEHGVGGA